MRPSGGLIKIGYFRIELVVANYNSRDYGRVILAPIVIFLFSYRVCTASTTYCASVFGYSVSIY